MVAERFSLELLYLSGSGGDERIGEEMHRRTTLFNFMSASLNLFGQLWMQMKSC